MNERQTEREMIMADISDYNVEELAEAEQKMQELEELAIERGRAYLKLHAKKNIPFINGNGFSVKVVRSTLLSENEEEVVFYSTDVQGRGNSIPVRIPRSFIFGEVTEKERRWEEYQKLKEEFEGK